MCGPLLLCEYSGVVVVVVVVIVVVAAAIVVVVIVVVVVVVVVVVAIVDIFPLRLLVCLLVCLFVWLVGCEYKNSPINCTVQLFT